ncbi:MAG: hypothetical protein OHK0047_38400 [Leptolyngbyaceae cyanobacterium]
MNLQIRTQAAIVALQKKLIPEDGRVGEWESGRVRDEGSGISSSPNFSLSTPSLKLKTENLKL